MRIGKLRSGSTLLPELLLAAGSILAVLMGLEIASRIWVGVRWNDGARATLLQDPDTAGRYTFDAEAGYRLRPRFSQLGRNGAYFTHNQHGFRARREFDGPPPRGVVRIAIVGASTVYGIFVDDTETSAAQLQAWLMQRHPSADFEVVNAGVPGWTTRETLLNLDRVLGLEPHIIIVVEGRNEIFPQLFDGYRDDYSHYRRIGYDYREGNRVYKSIFRLSYFAMLMATVRGERFGYRQVNENPSYGPVRWENRPEPEGIVRNGQDAERTRGYHANLEALIARAKARGVHVVLSSIPFLAERFSSGIFVADPVVLPVLDRFATMNNAIARAVAEERKLAFVDGASLAKPELLFDDCHFTPEGERAFAALMGLAIESLLPAVSTR